jgi:hypothetical protein
LLIPVCGDLPSRLGPRHCGHSGEAAAAKLVANKQHHTTDPRNCMFQYSGKQGQRKSSSAGINREGSTIYTIVDSNAVDFNW